MEWKIIFFITSKKVKIYSRKNADTAPRSRLFPLLLGGIYLFGCVVYWIWAQGEIQPWAMQENKPDERPKSANTQVTGFSNPALDIKE
jgi:hypothetical protein